MSEFNVPRHEVMFQWTLTQVKKMMVYRNERMDQPQSSGQVGDMGSIQDLSSFFSAR